MRAPSSAHVVEPRRAVGRHRDEQRAAALPRRATPSAPPARRHERALDEQLRRQPRASAAERRPHRELVLARRAARDQQVRDVDAGDEQQESDRAEQHEQRPPHLSTSRSARRSVTTLTALFVFGYSRSSAAAIACSSRSAASIDTPGFSRPTAEKPVVVAAIEQIGGAPTNGPIDMNRSYGRRYSKPRGITPTTV